jgi:serine/threonine protein kinase
MCGTPIFMAPEIVNREPYGKEVDIWSFGICLFLWQRGSSPYRSKTEPDLMREIKLCDFEYPETMSCELKDLLKKILVKDPKKRLTIKDILRHPFFSNHDSDLQSHYRRLLNRKVDRVSLTSLKTPEKESYTGDDSTRDNIDEVTIKKVKSTGYLHGRTVNKRQSSKIKN